MLFDVQTVDSAPPEAADALRSVVDRYGFVPNLIGVMANAPPLLEAYLRVGELFSRTSLTPLEQQVVLLATSVMNGCDYCVAAHTVVAKMNNVPDEIVQSIREGSPLSDPRLKALCALAAEMTDRRGWPTSQAIDDFLAAGFEPAQVLEVVLGVGMKTLSNYTNHIAHTRLDPQFAKAAWSSAAPNS